MMEKYIKLVALVVVCLSVSTSSFADKEKEKVDKSKQATHIEDGFNLVQDIAVSGRKRAARFIFVMFCAHAESANKKVDKCEE